MTLKYNEISAQPWHSDAAKTALELFNLKLAAAAGMEEEAAQVRQAALKSEDGATVGKLRADYAEMKLDTSTARINAVEHLIESVLPKLRESQKAEFEKAVDALQKEQKKRNAALSKAGVRRPGITRRTLELEAEGVYVRSQFASESEQAAEAHLGEVKQAGYAYGLLQAAAKRDLPALKAEREKLVLSLFVC